MRKSRRLPGDSSGWLTGLRILFVSVAISLLFSVSGVAHAASARVPTKVNITRLANTCTPAAVQAMAAHLSYRMTVGQIVNGPKLEGGTKYVAATATRPGYCQVTGSIVTNPKTGKTANFLATLPDAWNRKYLQFGCFGHCGFFALNDSTSPLVTIVAQGYPGQILEKGYASFGTDEGHIGASGGDWAIKGPGQVDEDAIEDFLYRSNKVLAQAGKAFTRAFYLQASGRNQRIQYSYLCGCSGGGRDAMVAASYFPEEFDGIVAGSPYGNGANTAFQVVGTYLATLRSLDADVPPALIAQIETISTVLTAVTDHEGRMIQPGYSVSEVLPFFRVGKRPADINAPVPWDEKAGSEAGLAPLGDAVLRIFTHENDPAFNTRSIFAFGRGGSGPITAYRVMIPREQAELANGALRMGIGSDPRNAARLIRQKHKLLIWHNASDEKLTPYMSINYYKQLAAMYGGYDKLQENVRLFLLPGTSHCSMSGEGPGNFDALSAIEDWVEKRQAPNGLVAALYSKTSPMIDRSKTPMRTMPLCKFPEMARHDGKGDINVAASWSCPQDDQRMLQVGESGRQAGVIE